MLSPCTNFKGLFILMAGLSGYYLAHGQCPTPIITVNGLTTFCEGDSLILETTFLQWKQKANLGGVATYKAVGFSIGSKGYVGTGLEASLRNDFWEYDPVNNVWTQKANFGGTARSGAVGFSIGSKGYLGTGSSNSASNDFWEYDPALNVWTKKANFKGAARSHAVGFSIGQKGYIGLGTSAPDFWEYDPVSDVWNQKANFAGVVSYTPVGFSIGQKGYVVTGGKNSFWEYDPGANVWKQKANFKGEARSYPVGFSIGSKGYIGTGTTSKRLNDFWEYDPATNAWTQKPNFKGEARSYAVGFSIGNKGYIGGGLIGEVIKGDFWEFDPSISHSWSTGNNISPSISVKTRGTYTFSTSNTTTGCTSTSLPIVVTVNPSPAVSIVASGPLTFCSGDSVILTASSNGIGSWTSKANFAGSARIRAVGFSIGNKGYIGTGNDGANKNDFWEYDASNNTWTQKANFGGTARSAAVGFSIANKGYIGTGNDGIPKKDFWEYDPASNTWRKKASFGGTARSRAVGFSIGNKGYIGTGNDGTNKNDFWEYDPANNTWIQKANFGGTARSFAVGFSIGSSGYIGTGNDGGHKNDFWAYNPKNNTWTQKANFGGTARSYAVGFSIGSKGYIGTGFDGSRSNDFWEFDPAANSWIQKAHAGGSVSVNAVGFSIGSTGYIATGFDGSSNKNDLWAYDSTVSYVWSDGKTTPEVTVKKNSTYILTATTATGCSVKSLPVVVIVNNTPAVSLVTDGPTVFCQGDSLNLTSLVDGNEKWTQKAFLNESPDLAVGFSIGSKGYVGTGRGKSGSYKFDFWEFNPTTNVWTQKNNFGGTARYAAVGFSIGSKGYLGTGQSSSYHGDFWEYDPSIDAWTQKANFGGTARFRPVGFAIGNKGYIGTGYDGSYKNDFWEYDPITNSWTQKANFGGVTRAGAVGLSIGNKGYIGTGHFYDQSKGSEIFLTDFWEYDPATDKWTQKASFGGTKRTLAVGFTIGKYGYIGTGTGLISGVRTNNRDFWEYNPGSDTWKKKADFGGYARYGAVGFAIGNKAYVGTSYSPYAPSYTRGDFWEIDKTISYNWSTGEVTPTINVDSTGKYSLRVTDVYGCKASGFIDVKENPLPTVAAITGNKSVCKGRTTQLSNATIGGTWSSSDTAKAKVSNTGLVTGVGVGNAIITYTTKPDSIGCINSTNVMVKVNGLPAVERITGTTTLCANKTTQLANSTAGGSWSSSNNNKATVSSTGLVTGVSAGTVTIRYTTAANSNGCINKATETVVVTAPCLLKTELSGRHTETTALKETSVLDVSIFPNPTGKFFNVQVKTPKQESISIRVLDVNGKVAYSSKGMPEQVFRFGEQLVSGIYLVEIRQGEEVIALKAVKMK